MTVLERARELGEVAAGWSFAPRRDEAVGPRGRAGQIAGVIRMPCGLRSPSRWMPPMLVARSLSAFFAAQSAAFLRRDFCGIITVSAMLENRLVQAVVCRPSQHVASTSRILSSLSYSMSTDMSPRSSGGSHSMRWAAPLETFLASRSLTHLHLLAFFSQSSAIMATVTPGR
ncbi:hypothetical protein B1L11_08560 [Microbispora sp. GKU 823]|nr:hypothetical protein B1L11_08560 [Microbispora sp. GKU 823]